VKNKVLQKQWDILEANKKRNLEFLKRRRSLEILSSVFFVRLKKEKMLILTKRKKTMKKIGKMTILFFLFVIYTYICAIDSIPNTLILFEGEEPTIKPMLGIQIENINTILNKEQVLQASSSNDIQKVSSLGKLDLGVSLFHAFHIKDVSVNILPTTKVVPLGNSVGMKLYTSGVLVVGMSEIEGQKPYENCDIEEGDRIVAINEEKIHTTDELIKSVNDSKGNNINIEYIRDNATCTTSIQPVKTKNDEYKIGLWVRDAAAGVGTLTFYEPSTGKYGALGHGILDIDTSELIEIAKGELVTTQILSIQKGERGNPGEVRGTIEGGTTLGSVTQNTTLGIYGTLTNKNTLHVNEANALDVALREEVKEGKATIYCQLDNGEKKEYEIEIKKIYKNNTTDNKSFLIKVTDEALLTKTGGIIQGMSGSPIIQNGKFIGAVTHVLVNDPTTGYGVFADMMLKQTRTVE